MSKNGTSTRAIDKAIQDFFTSPATRIEYVNGEPKDVRIPQVAVVNDCCLEASLASAEVLVSRLEAEHGISVNILEGTSAVIIQEIVEEKENDDTDQAPDEQIGGVIEMLVGDPDPEFPDDTETVVGDPDPEFPDDTETVG
jgi:hypothetical protein